MFKSQFLVEKIEDVTVLSEDNASGPKKLFIEGVFMQANIKNRNGRFYPDGIMEKESNRYIKESVEKNRAFGELGHPNHPNIDLTRASHLIKSLRKEGTNWIGKAEILNTPMGNVVRGILEAGGAIGASSRAIGSLKADKGLGAMVVQEDFRLATAADIVSDPSAPEAWMNSIMENKAWVNEGGIWVEQTVEAIREEVSGMKSTVLAENITRLFERYQAAVSTVKP